MLGYALDTKESVAQSESNDRDGEPAIIQMKTTEAKSEIYKFDGEDTSDKLLTKISSKSSMIDKINSDKDSYQSTETTTNIFPNIQAVYTVPFEIPFTIQTSSLDGVYVKVSAQNSRNRVAKTIMLDYEGNQVIQVFDFFYTFPVSIRRRFDVHTTSITLKRRRMDVKTTSCAYWVKK